MAAESTVDDIAYVTALVRESDRPRYYATLFAPAAVRGDLFALYGFAAEIAHVPEQVSEPALGEIRLRWWQDALAEAVAREDIASGPVLRAVAATIGTHRLPLAPLNGLIEARAADLYSDPPTALADVEGRMGEEESALFQMAAIILGGVGPETAEAAGHAGIAYGVARRLAAFASEKARGRTIVSADLLANKGVAAASIFGAVPRPGLAAAVAEMAAFARRHLRLARAETRKLPPPLRAAFLPLAAVEPRLRGVERLGPEIAARDAHVSDIEILLRVGLARLRQG